MLNLSSDFFERFFFAPLKRAQIEEHLRTQIPDIDRNQIEDIFSEWVLTFHRRSSLFYLTQYRRHERAVFLEFRQYYGIPEGDSPDQYDRGYEWEQCQKYYGLDVHYQDYEAITINMSEIDSVIKQHKEKVVSSLDDLYESLHQDDIFQEIDGLWFNNNIGNSPKEVKALCELAYGSYLMTPHWHRVRAAMLLIKRARCQAVNCYDSGDSWYGGGWESDLHVHHLNYSNRGNERYKDLALLCSRHHEQWHENVKLYGDSRIDIVETSMW